MKQWSKWRGVVAVVLALSLSHSFAQQWKAELPAVEKAGYHAILLSPEFVGRSESGVGDARLVDSSGREVPYLFGAALPRTVEVEWRDFRMVRNEVIGLRTVIELAKPIEQLSVDAIQLTIRSAGALKSVRVTGSDDGGQWYFVHDEFLALGHGANRLTRVEQTLEIPTSDYSYYRVTINDSLTEPVQVLGARWQFRESISGTWTTADDIRWTATDSTGHTRIRVRNPYSIIVDRIQFAVADTGRFRRPCAIEQFTEVVSGHGVKRRLWVQTDQLASFVLTSSRDASADLPGLLLDTFDIVIDNGDDRPLQFTDIKFLQLQRTLIAELQPGMLYVLTTGDPKKSAPQYDIIHFKDKLPEPIATISHGPLIALAATPEMGPSIAPSRWWIWAGLVAVLGIVGFMAVRMLREPQQPNG